MNRLALVRKPLLTAAVMVAVLEVGVQFAFGRIDVPGISAPWVELGLGDRPVPRGVFLHGACVGALYALIAMGFMLVYRANRVVNFAQASLGAVLSILALILMVRRGLPYPAALLLVVVGSLLLGVVVETVAIRPFRDAPRLILTVVTIGVSLVLTFFELLVPVAVKGQTLPTSSFPTPLGNVGFTIGIVRFRGDHVLTLVVTAVVALGMTLFFTRTRTGVTVRAAAENGERAALLGMPVRRTATVVWALAALLSGIAVFLRAPLVGLPLGGNVGPSVLLFGLTAAVVARMERFSTAFVAGVLIGALDQSVVFATGRAVLSHAVMLVVVLAVLLLQKDRFSRVRDSAASTWQSAREHRTVPGPVARLAPVVAFRVGLWVTIAVVALAAPIVVPERTTLFTQIVIWSIIGVSLVVLTGWGGQISLGQFAFAGVGAAVAGGLAANHNVDFFVAITLGGLAGAAAALLVGLPALRIQGLFLAVTTLVFGFTVEHIVLNVDFFPWLLPKDLRFVERPVLYGVLDVASDFRFYYVCVAFLLAAVAVCRALRRYRTGRILIGARDNERIVQSFAVDLARTRLTTFATSGFLAAVAGALLAYQQGSVDPGTYSTVRSVEVFVMTVIGGIASIPGAVLGAVYMLGVPALVESWLDPVVDYLGNDITGIRVLIAGLSLLVIVAMDPGGLTERLYRVRDRFLGRMATRAGIDVPTLVGAQAARPAAPPPAPEAPGAAGFIPAGFDAPSTGAALLECRDVEVAYDSVQILFGVDLSVHAGEVVALLGTNGAGKSTLLRAISGLTPAMGGSIHVAGEDLTNAGTRRMVQAGVVQVPGGRAVFPSLTVTEHLDAAASLHHGDDMRAAAIAEVLEQFPRLAQRLSQPAGVLSGGEQQMLAVGTALLARPRLLMIDELSLGLAPSIVEQLLVAVRRLRDQGVGVVVVEQSVNVALTVADRAYFLEKGEVRFEGDAAALLDRGDILRSVFLAGATSADTSAPRRRRPRPVEDTTATPALEVAGLSLSYGAVKAVVDVSFSVQPGRTLGLIGPNGAGKTTVMDLVSGFVRPDEGSIKVSGEDVTGLPPYARARRGLGRSFQDARLVPSLTVAENIAIGLERHLPPQSHLASALALAAVVREEEDVAWSVADLIELLRLGAFRDKVVRELSTGSRRIVDLAMCIAHDPVVLLLDEPSSGVAQRETEALAPLLRRVQRETGCALLVIEHDMPLISAISDEIVALELGSVIARGRPDHVLGDPRVVASYLGTDEAAIHRSGPVAAGVAP